MSTWVVMILPAATAAKSGVHCLRSLSSMSVGLLVKEPNQIYFTGAHSNAVVFKNICTTSNIYIPISNMNMYS